VPRPPASTIDQPQRIAIYGLKATSPPPERATLTPTGHNQFVPADNAFSIDGKNSGARLSSNAATGASIELNTFKSKSGPGIVPNEIVTGAKLRIKHAELGDVEEVKATVTGVGPDMVFSSKAPQCSLCVHPGAAPVEDKIDLPVPPLSATSPVAAMKVRYQVTLASGASKIFSEVLDGIAVDVDHGVPAIPVLPPVASLTSTFEATGHDQFTDPTNAFDIDGSKTADVALASGAATAASLSLSGFDQVSVPPDATINLLILKVAHQETGTTGDVSDIKLTVTPGGGGPPVVVHPAGCADLCDYPVDLKAAGVTTPAALAGLRVRYDVTLATGSNKSATAKLDGAQLDVSYVRVTGDGSTAELVPTGVGPTTGFDNADNALQIESPANAATADAMVTTVSKKASINLMGFFQHTVPSDAVIDEVTLRIAHKEANPADFASLTATVLPQPGPKPVSIEVPSHDTMTEDRINLRALGFDSAAKLAGLEVDYEVTAATGSTGTESLDGVAIEVKYREPRLEALTGCSVTGDCAVFQADVPAKLAVQGTLYTPTAAVSLHLGGTADPVKNVVLARGVISRSVDLAIEAPPCSSPPPCDPTIMVPDSPSDTKVFTAYLDQNGTIKELLRTTVLFGPQPLPTSVEVKAWSVLI